MSVPPLSLCQLAFPHTTFAEDVDLCRRLAYDGISVDERKLDRAGSVSPGAFAETGLKAAVCTPGLLTILPAPEFPEPLDVAARVALIADGIRKLAPYGPESVMVCTGPAGAYSDARALVAGKVRDLQKVAADLGTRVAVEPMRVDNRDTFSFLTELSDTVDFVRSIDPGVAVVFDTWHMWDTPDLASLLPDVLPALAGIQVSDYRPGTRSDLRFMPGDGEADLPSLFATFRRAGYAGWLDVEIFSTELWALPPAEFLTRARAGTLACWGTP